MDQSDSPEPSADFASKHMALGGLAAELEDDSDAGKWHIVLLLISLIIIIITRLVPFGLTNIVCHHHHPHHHRRHHQVGAFGPGQHC